MNVSAVCEELINRTVDLIQDLWQRGRIADVVRGQIGADNLTADKIETKVQLAPRAPFALVFMLFLEPFLTRQAHAQHAAERAPSPKIFRPVPALAA
jgi:hypothetical protein